MDIIATWIHIDAEEMVTGFNKMILSIRKATKTNFLVAFQEIKRICDSRVLVRDAAQLIHKMELLITQPEVRGRMDRKAKKRFAAHFLLYHFEKLTPHFLEAAAAN